MSKTCLNETNLTDGVKLTLNYVEATFDANFNEFPSHSV